MKCYYHPEKDAVSTCRCGKTACRDCIDDVGESHALQRLHGSGLANTAR